MLIFAAIAIAGFIFTAGAMLFGHDHDVDIDHDIDHDADHGDTGSSSEPTVSFFSSKVLGTLVTAWGATAAIARYEDASYLLSSLLGTASGLLFALMMFGLLRLIYGQQATTVVGFSDAVGQEGVIETSIPENGTGQISVSISNRYGIYNARSVNGESIHRGKSVKVISVQGDSLIVSVNN